LAEALKCELTRAPNSGLTVYQFTVAAATTISKGYLCSFADPNTASKPTTAQAGMFAGISYTDKDGGDSSTTLGFVQDGVWDIRSSGAITAGDKVILAGNNEVKSVVLALGAAPAITSQALFIQGIVVGTAMETGTDQEYIQIDIGNR